MPNQYDYLKAADIAPIMIETSVDTGITTLICRGQKYDDATVWVEADYRSRVMRRASRSVKAQCLQMFGVRADRNRVVAALHEAAKYYGVTLTAHLIVVSRAARLSYQLDCLLEELKANGLLKQFHQEYARHRRERKAQGAGYMNFAAAQRRFRNALIERLIQVQSQPIDSGLIDRVLTGERG